jgi:hypothetical protein
MRAEDTYFSREDRYSLGFEHDSGKHYASFPVTNGIVDYEEFYALTPEEYEHFLADHAAAVAFVEEARRHEHDELLIQKPGWNRGIPY